MSDPSTRLSVNLNKVALLRNQRDYGVPSVVRAGRVCLDAGAAGLTVHPRPDQRHIRPHDVDDLLGLLAEYPGREFNIEGNPFTGDWLRLVEAASPTQATLVPDDPGQSTSDHGWDLSKPDTVAALGPVIERLRRRGIRVSLFMDPAVEQVRRAAETGADRIELYTEPYAAAFRTSRAAGLAALRPYIDAAAAARERGLGLNAGHDLNLANLSPLIDAIPDLAEVSIGHELTADALWMGMQRAVRAYLDLLAAR
jgi:pyridoxine 5-phosphate synthase